MSSVTSRAKVSLGSQVSLEDADDQPRLLRKGILHPNGTIRGAWDVLIILVLIYNSIVLPYRVCFAVSAEGSMFIFETFLDAIFFLDLALNFRTAYFYKDKLVTDGRKIGLNYAKGWFLVDLVSTLPLDLIISSSVGASTDRNLLRLPRLLRLARLARLLRLLRLFRLTRIFRKAQLHISINFAVIKMFKLALLVIFLAHFMACLFFLVASLRDLDETTWVNVYKISDASKEEQYLAALYWAVTTIATVGYGDIAPRNHYERLFVLFALILGVTAFSYVVGSMSGLVQQMDFKAIEFHTRMAKVNSYLRYRKLPKNLQFKVREHYRYAFDSQAGIYEESAILSELSPALRTEVAIHINGAILRNIPFLKSASPAAITAVVLKLRPVIVQPGEAIVVAGEPGHHLYVITSGQARVISPDGFTILASLGAGSYFGEIALIYPVPRTATVTAFTTCDLCCLSKDDFDQVIVDFPEIRGALVSEAERRIHDNEIAQSLVQTSRDFLDMIREGVADGRLPPRGITAAAVEKVFFGDPRHQALALFPSKIQEAVTLANRDGLAALNAIHSASTVSVNAGGGAGASSTTVAANKIGDDDDSLAASTAQYHRQAGAEAARRGVAFLNSTLQRQAGSPLSPALPPGAVAPNVMRSTPSPLIVPALSRMTAGPGNHSPGLEMMPIASSKEGPPAKVSRLVSDHDPSESYRYTTSEVASGDDSEAFFVDAGDNDEERGPSGNGGLGIDVSFQAL